MRISDLWTMRNTALYKSDLGPPPRVLFITGEKCRDSRPCHLVTFQGSCDFEVCFYCSNKYFQVYDLNWVQDMLLPNYLPTFPDSPDHFCGLSSIPRCCSISMKFAISVFHMISQGLFLHSPFARGGKTSPTYPISQFLEY